MANALYDKGREGFLDGSIDWDTHTIEALLVRTSGSGAGPYYSLDLANDDNLDDIPNNADCRPASAITISSKTVTDGVADGGNITFLAVPSSGDAIQLVIIYKDTGVESSSRLAAAFDTMTGLPITPNGDNILVTWSSDANRIFKL